MKKCLVALILLLLCLAPCASADTFTLANWAFNVNGDIYFGEHGDPVVLPGNFDVSGFDFDKGYGTITILFNTPGTYNVLGFVDHDGNPWDKDLGAEIGVLPPGLSWEIGQPYDSTIADDFWNGVLLNSNLAGGGEHRDISMALGLNFDLLSGSAYVHFYLSPNVPSGFYLNQKGSQDEVVNYRADVQYGGTVIPEPATLVLLGSGLLGLGARLRRK